jgi:hypothetical protein
MTYTSIILCLYLISLFQKCAKLANAVVNMAQLVLVLKLEAHWGFWSTTEQVLGAVL